MPETQEPEDRANQPDETTTLSESIEDLRRLIDDFDDTRPDDMTVHFYVHAFNMLIEAGRDLVHALDTACISERGTEPRP